jgi:capsular exopolysaccharide synthesis family protein
MGRINDALRREGTLRAEPSALEAVGADVFVSPWTVGADHVERSVPKEKAARSVIDCSPPGSTPQRRVVPPLLIERFKPGWRERLTISADADPLLVHQFHRLAAPLFQEWGGKRLKSLMITSADPGDGKTLTALNLALVLSNSYRRRVLLIEGDLRRPAITGALNLEPGDGLSAALKASDDRKVPLIQLTDNLTLSPAGRPDPEPLSGLTSPRMQRFLQDASEQFDWVILDTPPLGATADAGLLCPLVDAVILVIRARQTACAAVQAAVETLGRERILGVVLNGVDRVIAAGYDAGYGYGEYSTSRL